MHPYFVLPIEKAKVEKEGKDVSIVSFSKQVGNSLKAAEQEKFNDFNTIKIFVV